MSTTHEEVKQWFSVESINKTMAPTMYRVEEIARAFLVRGGHRWRPFLFAGIYQALTGKTAWLGGPLNLVLAIECFHKASVIHDHIEDNDKPEALHCLV